MVMVEATTREEYVAEVKRKVSIEGESKAWRRESGGDISSWIGSEEMDGGCGMKEAEDEV